MGKEQKPKGDQDPLLDTFSTDTSQHTFDSGNSPTVHDQSLETQNTEEVPSQSRNEMRQKMQTAMGPITRDVALDALFTSFSYAALETYLKSYVKLKKRPRENGVNIYEYSNDQGELFAQLKAELESGDRIPYEIHENGDDILIRDKHGTIIAKLVPRTLDEADIVRNFLRELPQLTPHESKAGVFVSSVPPEGIESHITDRFGDQYIMVHDSVNDGFVSQIQKDGGDLIATIRLDVKKEDLSDGKRLANFVRYRLDEINNPKRYAMYMAYEYTVEKGARVGELGRISVGEAVKPDWGEYDVEPRGDIIITGDLESGVISCSLPPGLDIYASSSLGKALQTIIGEVDGLQLTENNNE